MAEGDTPTLPAEARSAIESIAKMKTNAEALAAESAALQARVAAIEKINQQSIRLPGAESEKHKYSIARLCKAIHTGDWSEAGFEREVHDQTMKRLSGDVQTRVTSTLTGGAGGYLVPQEMAPNIIEKFQAKAIAKRLGATVLRPSGNPLILPKETGFPTVSAVGEGANLSNSDPSFGQVTFNPKKLAVIVTITDEMVMWASPSIDAFISKRIGERLAVKQDQQVFHGAGSSNEITGILPGLAANPWGIQTQAAVTTTEVNLGDINKAMSKIDFADVPLDKIAVAIQTQAKWEMYRTLFKQFTSQTEGGAAAGGAGYIFQVPFVTDQRFKELTGGIDIASSSQLSITLAAGGNETWPIVGKWDELAICEWGGIVLSRSTDATVNSFSGFANGGIHIKAQMWHDAGILQPDAFCAITGVVASF